MTRNFFAGNIFCIGRNYREHAEELNHPVPTAPVVFLKPSQSLQVGANPLVLPPGIGRIDPEVELVLRIGKLSTESSVLDWIDGFAIGLDVTARDEQTAAKAKGLPWLLSKGRKGFAPVSAFLSPREIGYGPFEIALSVNGKVRQSASTEEMLFSLEKILNFLNKNFGLSEGDLVFTGTPKGVGPVFPGDSLTASLKAAQKSVQLELKCIGA